MDFLRTSEERFEDLPGFPWGPEYLDDLPGNEGLRLHYVDVTPPPSSPVLTGDVYLCLHGEPTWAYLYRKMIPPFVEAGGRVVAPDFFGFGRSDKPVDDEVYTFDFHRSTLTGFIERLELDRITLVCQDWGGVLGLTLPMEMPGRFRRLLVMNTALPTGEERLPLGFVAWRTYARGTPDLDVGWLISRACPGLEPGEIAAYEAPFPDRRYKAGVRRFPEMVPDRPEAPGAATIRRAREWLSTEWDGDSFMAVGAQDPVLGPPVMRQVRKAIRGCPEALVLEGAGHFVQEQGDLVAEEALHAWATPSR